VGGGRTGMTWRCGGVDCPGRCAGAGKNTGGRRGGEGAGLGRGGTTWRSGGADCPRRGAGAGRGVDGGRADAAERRRGLLSHGLGMSRRAL